jgi:hypothetical protein
MNGIGQPPSPPKAYRADRVALLIALSFRQDGAGRHLPGSARRIR